MKLKVLKKDDTVLIPVSHRTNRSDKHIVRVKNAFEHQLPQNLEPDVAEAADVDPEHVRFVGTEEVDGELHWRYSVTK